MPAVPAAEWAKDRFTAEIWWCGDDVCDCTKPQIICISPNRDAGYPYVRRQAVWEGRFLTGTSSYTTAEREQLQYGPLRAACHRFGVPIPQEIT